MHPYVLLCCTPLCTAKHIASQSCPMPNRHEAIFIDQACSLWRCHWRCNCSVAVISIKPGNAWSSRAGIPNVHLCLPLRACPVASTACAFGVQLSLVCLCSQKQREVREKEEAIRRQKEQVSLYLLLCCTAMRLPCSLSPLRALACVAPACDGAVTSAWSLAIVSELVIIVACSASTGIFSEQTMMLSLSPSFAALYLVCIPSQ